MTNNYEITPYILDGYLIIALHPDWMKLFNGIPKFMVKIDGKYKLHLIAKEVS